MKDECCRDPGLLITYYYHIFTGIVPRDVQIPTLPTKRAAKGNLMRLRINLAPDRLALLLWRMF